MLEILKYPDPRLKQVSQPVEHFDASLHQNLSEMTQSMYRDGGIGLAAPQVGLLHRLFIIDIAPAEAQLRELHEFINPKLSGGEGNVAFEEGCLSIPGISEKINRHAKITVDYQDRNGNKQQMKASDLLAVAIQHENDHLDGILFIDRLSLFKRRLIKKKIKKVLLL